MASAARPRTTSLALLALALAGAAGCGLLAVWSNHHTHVAQVILMACIAPIPFVVRAYQRRWDPFEPINLLVLGIIMWFVARPIYEIVTPINPYPGYNQSLGFTEAMWIGIVGTSCVYIGYFARVGPRVAARFQPLPDDWDSRRAVRYAVKLLMLAAFLTLGYMAQAGVHFVIDLFAGRAASQRAVQHSVSAYFEEGPYLTIPTSLILLVAWSKRRDLATGVLAICTTATALLITVPRGDRTFILELALPLLALFYLRRGRRPSLRFLLIALVIFGVGANVEVALRNKETRPGKSVVSTVLTAIEHPWQPLGKQFVTGADPSEFSVLEIEAHAYSIGLLKQQHFGTIRNILIGWIPHQFLKKPLTPLQYVTWTLFPATLNAGSYGPPMFGSMFADFGWATVVFFSLLIGIGLAGIWAYFRDRLSNHGMQLVFAGILPMIPILVRDDIDDIFYRSVFIVVPLIICVRVCSRRPRRIRELLWIRARNSGKATQRSPSRGAIPARSAAP